MRPPRRGRRFTMLRHRYDALHPAAQHGDVAHVATFLAGAAVVDEADADGVTALRRAARGGHVRVAAALLAAAACVATDDDIGRTPLHATAEVGHA